MNFPIEELDDELSEILLSALGERLQRAVFIRDDAQSKVEELEAKIDRITNRMRQSESIELAMAALTMTPTGRVKRGETEKVVADFLRNRNGSGASIQEVVAATKTKYGTVRRILHNFAKEKSVTQASDSRWHWAGNYK